MSLTIPQPMEGQDPAIGMSDQLVELITTAAVKVAPEDTVAFVEGVCSSALLTMRRNASRAAA